MSQKGGIVHLYDLPKDSVCIKLPNDIQKSMVEDVLSLVNNSPKKLSNALNIDRITIYDFKRSRFQSVVLNFVLKLSKFLEQHGFENFSIKNLEGKIEIIKAKFVGNAIFNPKFPLNFNRKEGAEVIAAIMFDGGITSLGYPFYTNNEEVLIEKMIKNVEKVVGKIEYNKRGHTFHPETLRVEFPKIFGYVLINGLGILPGSKIFNNPSVPQFILNNKTLHRAFLQQAFDDEGTVNKGMVNGGGKSIQLNQYSSSKKSPMRLFQLKELTENFGIAVNGPYGPSKEYKAKKGYSSYGFMIEISNQSDIRKFEEKINFSLERKRKALNELLNSYISPSRFKDGARLNVVIKACKKLKEENKKITNKNIANKINRNKVYIAELTSMLVKEGKLKVIKDKLALKGFGRGFEEKEFELVMI